MDGAALDRYVRALARADIPKPKELDVSIRPAAVTDALVDEIAAVADEVGALRFAIMDGVLVSFAKFRGNPWDLDDVLGGLRRLSQRLPELTFHLRFDPDGADGTLCAGELALDGSAALASWVAAHPRPRFAGGTLTANIELHAPAAERAALRTSLAHRIPGTLTVVAAGFALAANGARELVQALSAAKAMMLVEPPWQVSLELSGAVSLQISVDGVGKLLALDDVIATWLRDAAFAEPIPASVAPPVAALPPAPALAQIAEPDRLVLELDDRSRFTLGRDGGFEPIEPARPSVRGRPVGELDGARVSYSLVELQLGRIQSVIEVRASDGSERTSAVLINVSGHAVDPDRHRVLSTSERDGVRELVAIDPQTMEISTLRRLAFDPHELFVCRGAIIALVTEQPRIQLIRVSEHGESGDEPLATVRGRLWRMKRRDDTLQIIALDTTSEPPAATCYEVSLVDGSMRSALIGVGHSSTFALAGDWLAWCDRDDAAEVRLFHGLELRRTIAPRAGFSTWSIDVSSSGAVVRVVADDKSSLLDVIRGDDRVELAVPLGASAKWAIDL